MNPSKTDGYDEYRKLSAENPNHDTKAWERLDAFRTAAGADKAKQQRAFLLARELYQESLLPSTLSDLQGRYLGYYKIERFFLPMEASELVTDLGHRLFARSLLTHRVVACTTEKLASDLVNLLPKRPHRVYPLLLIADTERGCGFSTRIVKPIDERRITILTPQTFAYARAALQSPFAWTSDIERTFLS